MPRPATLEPKRLKICLGSSTVGSAIVCTSEPRLYNHISAGPLGHYLGPANLCSDPEFAVARAIAGIESGRADRRGLAELGLRPGDGVVAAEADGIDLAAQEIDVERLDQVLRVGVALRVAFFVVAFGVGVAVFVGGLVVVFVAVGFGVCAPATASSRLEGA